MKIEVHPLVVAAALGFLGPAALTEEEDGVGMGGVWSRISQDRHGPQAAADGVVLGSQLEVTPIEDRLILDDGESLDVAATWSLDDQGRAHQELVVDGYRVVRQLKQDGDALQVRTTIDADGQRTVLLDCYTRHA
jgi:hypothetical protein